jgi:type IV secretion system protein VirD4
MNLLRRRQPQWGPGSQRDTGEGFWQRRTVRWTIAVVVVTQLAGEDADLVTGAVLLTLAAVVVLRVGRWLCRRATISRTWIARATDPVGVVQARVARAGGGPYLGTTRRGRWRTAGREHAVLVLGPPRSGKTSALIMPAVLSHTGPVVSASTKPDVLAATVGARSRSGEVWRFDPTGYTTGPRVPTLRWSPVQASGSWDGALLMARSMVSGSGVGAGTTDSTHWAKRATALLAALLHAAALNDKGVDVVLDWVLRHELDQAGMVLEQRQSRQACAVLVGIQSTEARERSSICSAAADAIDAYTSDHALAAATDPNFDADRFVRSADTIYVHAPAEQQALAAPLVCGLLSDIRRATYDAHARGQLAGRLLFALDEVANIAPLAELPAIASEGGGQGLVLLAALQDLSQARARWGTAADGFLTLFGTKLILPGVADQRTLEALSIALGDYDRRVASHTRRPPTHGWFPETSHTVSTQRQRVLSPGEIANIPAGHALHLRGVAWELLTLTPTHRCQPWRALTQLPSVEADTAHAVGVGE